MRINESLRTTSSVKFWHSAQSTVFYLPVRHGGFPLIHPSPIDSGQQCQQSFRIYFQTRLQVTYMPCMLVSHALLVFQLTNPFATNKGNRRPHFFQSVTVSRFSSILISLTDFLDMGSGSRIRILPHTLAWGRAILERKTQLAYVFIFPEPVFHLGWPHSPYGGILFLLDFA